MSPKPAPPSTQDAQKKAPVEDDTSSLTELEKQAEMEVNSLTRKKNKGIVNYANFLTMKNDFFHLYHNCCCFIPLRFPEKKSAKLNHSHLSLPLLQNIVEATLCALH